MPNIGYKPCPAPTKSPWGKVQTSRELAPGIWSVTTASHGGIKLSRERNAAVPGYMRVAGGWYEEDCDWAIAAVVHPIGFMRTGWDKENLDRTEFDYAIETLRNWHPESYEYFSGIRLRPGDSFKRDERIFNEENIQNFVVVSASGSWAAWVPEGMVGTTAVRRSDGCRKTFLVPEEEYKARSRFGFVIDLAKHAAIELPEGH